MLRETTTLLRVHQQLGFTGVWSLKVVSLCFFYLSMESLSFPFQRGEDSTAFHAESDLVRKGPRRKREFIPEEKKDALYWEKRRKNNEAAKRSREKRKLNDYALESHFMALKEENTRLSSELMAIKLHFGLAQSTAYTGRQSNQLQHHSHSSIQHSTYNQSLQGNPYWSTRDSSSVANHQSSYPFLIPAYALHTMRGYSYINGSGTGGSGVLPPLVLPRNLLPPYSACPGTLLPKPHPTRATSDKEEEQQVPGFQYQPVPHHKTRKDKSSPVRQYISD
ncbi:nuclear factor interleukin-3-regulated protein-like [Poeciliopsis prolifica]|uniref:nuclear factor interleukin-3-regulated protein-like n=1 Tax=Poeciliopsis prolifica TaxID=188132 RepID=UPI002412EA92|nr:nuclear factor interleukin-3-regulated protein-like [Poeciliopsis prolifica]